MLTFHIKYFDVKIAGQSKIKLEDFFDRKELNKLDRFSTFAIIAADQAIIQSGILNDNISKDKIGVIVGSGIGGISTFEKQHSKLLKNPRYVSPFFIPAMIPDIAPGHISIKHGFTGVNYSVTSACATSNHAFGDAFKMIQLGMADVIIAGGSEAAITEMSIAGFSNMKALTKNQDKDSASRPFDKNRDGFVMGEGAGALVLEEYNHAKQREATRQAIRRKVGKTKTPPEPAGELTGELAGVELLANQQYHRQGLKPPESGQGLRTMLGDYVNPDNSTDEITEDLIIDV